ncbi:helix-turn-helix domain-containing protein [Loigolactobacillus bifermentans]|uniref:Uncharacterized protein n=1 Tax=Loigolactobacillus bifermentans DSM 20003 TaxID=1423726 RepID=A0A0R1H2M9_9LACO|nr:helix-turn-helix domain-containing protein [Loigolactobacillus bifermentans]KRK40812.1 hypothetical protein FC07_GL002561 [Loigolactobacillus bifermentans DSM 20003]QGG59564.1 terminase [Loigolactobacillus bifermentans]
MGKGKYAKWLTKEGLIKLGGWARDGLTDDQIAHNMGISRSTLSDWKSRFPDISDALIKEKEVADYQVENALFKRATGMTIVEKTFTLVSVPDDALELRRRKFMNTYKLDHPESSLQEVQDAAVEAVPAMEKVQTAEYHKQLPPDVGAMQFWLRNRQSLKYRDQSFAELNKAQAEKAKKDAEKAGYEAKIAKAKAEMLDNTETTEDKLALLMNTIKTEVIKEPEKDGDN